MIRAEISDKIEEMEGWKRQIEAEWENVYDKFRSLTGRADRRLRRSKEQTGVPLDGQQMSPDPEEAAAQIIAYAKKTGQYR